MDLDLDLLAVRNSGVGKFLLGVDEQGVFICMNNEEWLVDGMMVGNRLVIGLWSTYR